MAALMKSLVGQVEILVSYQLVYLHRQVAQSKIFHSSKHPESTFQLPVELTYRRGVSHGSQHIFSSILFGSFLIRSHTSGNFIINCTLHNKFFLTGYATLRNNLIYWLSFFLQIIEKVHTVPSCEHSVGLIPHIQRGALKFYS